MTFAPIIGACSVSFPTGMSEEGLPYSAQLTGKRFADALVLEVATAYEKRVPPLRNTKAAV